MKTKFIPFMYPPQSCHERETLRRAGHRFISPPQPGDWVCNYISPGVGSVIVKTSENDELISVSDWFNQIKTEWRKASFIFEA